MTHPLCEVRRGCWRNPDLSFSCGNYVPSHLPLPHQLWGHLLCFGRGLPGQPMVSSKLWPLVCSIPQQALRIFHELVLSKAKAPLLCVGTCVLSKEAACPFFPLPSSLPPSLPSLPLSFLSSFSPPSLPSTSTARHWGIQWGGKLTSFLPSRSCRSQWFSFLVERTDVQAMPQRKQIGTGGGGDGGRVGESGLCTF